MKHNGAPVDMQKMEQRKLEAEKAMEKLRRDIVFMIGDVNIGANCGTKAFKDYLYKTLGLPVMKVTATENEAADDQTMIAIALDVIKDGKDGKVRNTTYSCNDYKWCFFVIGD